MSQTLTDEQNEAVRRWAEEGASLSDIQKRLDDEFEVRITFMESRFLIADLGIELKSEEKPSEDEDEAESSALADTAFDDAHAPAGGEAPGGLVDADGAPAASDEDVADADADAADADAGDAGGGVSVTISEVQRPGMMASGMVTFAGGKQAEWYLDQLGQLGMNPTDPEFRPSQDDMLAFQKELQRVAQSKGF